MYRECGQIDKAINLLEDYVNTQTTNTDWSVLDLLISLYLRNNAPSEALKQIKKARLQLRSQHKLPVQLQAKEVICHAYLGDMKHAEVCSKWFCCISLDTIHPCLIEFPPPLSLVSSKVRISF
jgi:general transcription factor 3C polypeptide 3 (transcription factor C subunit 4)